MSPCEAPTADLLVFGDWIILSSECVLQDSALAICGGAVLESGPAATLSARYPQARRLGGSGCLVLPGLINTHTHLFQTFIKGVGQELALQDWVRQVTTPAALHMSERDMYLSAMVGLLESLRCGTTFVAEYSYAYPSPDMHYAILQAFVDSGMSGWLGMGLNDTGIEDGTHPALVQPVDRMLARADDLRAQIARQAAGSLTLALTPSSLRGISEGGARSIAGYTHQHRVPWSLHINESANDNRIAQKRAGRNVISLLNDYGVLSPDLLAVHCVQMEDADIRLLADNGVSVSHNPVSNMLLGSGICRVLDLRAAGVTVGLATDGAASNNSQDMLESLKLAALGQRVSRRASAAMTAAEAFNLATTEAARAVHRPDIGALLPGCRADLSILNTLTPKMTPVHDPLAAVVFSCGEENVRTVVIGGRVVLEDGHFVNIDEAAILSEAQSAAGALLKRI